MDHFLDKSVFTLKRSTEELNKLIRLKLSRVLANSSFKNLVYLIEWKLICQDFI